MRVVLYGCAQAVAEAAAQLEEAQQRVEALAEQRDMASRDAAQTAAAIETQRARAAALLDTAKAHRDAAAVSSSA